VNGHPIKEGFFNKIRPPLCTSRAKKWSLKSLEPCRVAGMLDKLSLCILMSGGLNFGLCDAGRTSEHQSLDRDEKARNAAS